MDRLASAVLGASLLIACGPPSAETSTSEPNTTTTSPSSSDADSDSDTDSETTTSSTETDSTSDTITTSSLIPEDDVSPGANVCSVFDQDCPDGEKCVPFNDGNNWGEDSYKCVPVLGDQAVGSPCTSAGELEATDDCDATSYCWGYGEGLTGECMAFCQNDFDNPICPPMSECLSYLYVCQPYCDPLDPNACAPGKGCYWTNALFVCLDTEGEGIEPGQACGLLNDCAPGSACLQAEFVPDCDSSACCSPFCDVELGDADCGALPGTSCVMFFEDPAPEEYQNVGVCIVP